MGKQPSVLLGRVAEKEKDILFQKAGEWLIHEGYKLFPLSSKLLIFWKKISSCLNHRAQLHDPNQHTNIQSQIQYYLTHSIVLRMSA